VLDSYESIIHWHELLYKYKKRKNWVGTHKDAAACHKIKLEEYINAPNPNFPVDVVQKLQDLAQKHKIYENKPVIVSDCAVFEFNFTNMLFKFCGQNIFDSFHYSVWDTNLMQYYLNPDEDTAPKDHRAINDVKVLREELMGSFRRVKETIDEVRRIQREFA